MVLAKNTAKWMEMLVESNRTLSRVAVLWDSDTGPVQLDSDRKAARTLNVQLEVLEVRRPSDFDAAFLMANKRESDAMVMPSSPLIAPNVQVLAEPRWGMAVQSLTLDTLCGVLQKILLGARVFSLWRTR